MGVRRNVLGIEVKNIPSHWTLFHRGTGGVGAVFAWHCYSDDVGEVLKRWTSFSIDEFATGARNHIF
jgi:hypothetical protein